MTEESTPIYDKIEQGEHKEAYANAYYSVANTVVEEKPVVPSMVRTVMYVVLVIVAAIELFTVSTAHILFGENAGNVITILSAASAAVSLIAGSFGVFYRPTGPRANETA